MKKIELLAPAGNLEKVKWAFMYGADAVYFGGRDYSLRANAENLSVDEIKEACEFAHNLGKKVYVTTNIVFHNEDFSGLEDYLKALYDVGVDAVIVSDPSVISLIKEVVPNLEIHISTQQNTLNYEVCNFWSEEGAKRVVLGRETSKEDMLSILKNSNVEIEVFIQGAMCVSYSGRCVLSNYFTNRDSNRGGCCQVCRFVFDLDKERETYQIVFFITDGEDTSEQTLKSYSGLDKYVDGGAVLGYGTKEGGPMRPVYYAGDTDEPEYLYYYDDDFNRLKAISKLDEDNLKSIADDLGVEYVHMTKQSNIDDTIKGIQDEIGPMEMNNDIVMPQGDKEFYYIFIIPLVVLLIIDFIYYRRKIFRKA